MTDTASDIIEFWIGDAARDAAAAKQRTKLWYQSTAELDAELDTRFGEHLARAARGELDDWMQHAESSLALVILLDQFSRNIHRGTAAAFANDMRAQHVTRKALAAGFDRQLSMIGRVFLLHPLHHAEDLASHADCVRHYEAMRAEAPAEWHELLDDFLFHAREHRDVIERFGRFPHRNAVLGRTSTEEEQAYLDSGARRYGQ